MHTGDGEDNGLLSESWEELSELPPKITSQPSSRTPSQSPTSGGEKKRPSNLRNISSPSTHNGGPQTPRTPKEVRFELPTAAVTDVEATAAHHTLHRDSGESQTRDYRRDSEEDGEGDGGHDDDNHNAPLLPNASTAIASALELDNPLERKTSSLQAAISNMSNSILGAGIIGQPYALKEAGLASGVLLLIVLTVVIDWTIRLIVINSKMSGRNTFQGTVEFCFGNWGLLTISLAQWAFAFGGMVAFAVIVGDSIPPVMEAVWPGVREVPVIGWLAGRTGSIIVFCGGVSWPLSLYRDISKLAKASTLALFSMLIIVVTVLTQGYTVPKEERGDFPLKLWTINTGIFQAIGVISFAFVCHHNTLLIYSSLSRPTLTRFSLLTHISTAISLLACLCMALSGFLTFGSLTSGNVLNNYPDSIIINLARFCFGLNMLTTLPLEAFVCREVMVNYFWPAAAEVEAVDGVNSTAADPHGVDGHTSTFVHVALTTGLVWSATLIATQVCDLGAVFEIIGATSASVMAYILPPLCYLKLSKKQDWRRKAAWAVVVFGCTVAGMTLLISAVKLIRGEHDPVKQCRQ